jgi:5-hydroxyisourate hydrolase-like protein (transthyretin family)
MAFRTENIYKITFKDGTFFESRGCAESDIKFLNVIDEFKWAGWHISKEISLRSKNMQDIERVEYRMLNLKP